MRLTTCSILAGLAALVSAGAASAITIRHDVPRSEHDALASRYTSSGFYGYYGDEFDPEEDSLSQVLRLACSGTLVSPTHVLTAAHCLDFDRDGNADFDPSELVFGFDNDMSDGAASDTHTVASIDIHPAWSQFGVFDGDLAVLTLDTPVTHITPTEIFTGDPLGSEVTYVGYGGRDVAFPEGLLDTGMAGTKSAANNLIEEVDYEAGIIGSDFDGPGDAGVNFFGSSAPLPLEGTTSPGDSGGGVFLNIDGTDYLVGVTSFGFPDFDQRFGYNDAAFGTWLGHSGYRDFLGSFGLAPVPEPASAAVLGTALSMLAAARSRHS